MTDAGTGLPCCLPRPHPRVGKPRGRPLALTEAERRDRVLEAAERLFIHAGYGAVTMDQCAGEAAMSKRTLYQVFPSKAELFRALLADRFLLQALPPYDAEQPIEAQLAAALRTMGATCLDARHVALMRVMIGEAGTTADMAEALDWAGLGRGEGVLGRWLTDAVARGALPPLDVSEAEHFLFFAALGQSVFATLLGLAGTPTPRAVLDLRIERAVRAFLVAHGGGGTPVTGAAASGTAA